MCLTLMWSDDIHALWQWHKLCKCKIVQTTDINQPCTTWWHGKETVPPIKSAKTWNISPTRIYIFRITSQWLNVPLGRTDLSGVRSQTFFMCRQDRLTYLELDGRHRMCHPHELTYLELYHRRGMCHEAWLTYLELDRRHGMCHQAYWWTNIGLNPVYPHPHFRAYICKMMCKSLWTSVAMGHYVTLVLVLASCCSSSSHQLNQCSLLSTGSTRIHFSEISIRIHKFSAFENVVC